MFEFLDTYEGTIKINNTQFSKSDAVNYIESHEGDVIIELIPPIIQKNKELEYIVYVKALMTKTNEFDYEFQNKLNHGIPMPLRVMCGNILESTRTMYKMELYGKAMKIKKCMRCGRTLTNPISMYYGIGEECAKDLNFKTPENIINYNKYKELIEDKINTISWTGWIPKSAIESIEKIKEI